MVSRPALASVRNQNALLRSTENLELGKWTSEDRQVFGTHRLPESRPNPQDSPELAGNTMENSGVRINLGAHPAMDSQPWD